MTTAFTFSIVLIILGLVLYGLERNRPQQLQTGSLHGAPNAEDRDISRLHAELRVIADQRRTLLSRWSSPSRRISPVWRPWHLS